MERVLDLSNEDFVASVEMMGIGIFHEEIIRCIDCKHYDTRWDKCNRLAVGFYDPDEGADVIERFDVDPNGFCYLAERRA